MAVVGKFDDEEGERYPAKSGFYGLEHSEGELSGCLDEYDGEKEILYGKIWAMQTLVDFLERTVGSTMSSDPKSAVCGGANEKSIRLEL